MITDWKNAWEEKNKSFDNYKREVKEAIRLTKSKRELLKVLRL